MQTPDFAADLASVIELARADRVALMCAEPVPWRCHRSLIGDALLVHGVAAGEIVRPERLQPHRLMPFACVRGEEMTYPFAEPSADLLDHAGPIPRSGRPRKCDLRAELADAACPVEAPLL